MHLPRISSVESGQSRLCYARRPALSLTWVKEGNSRASVVAYVFWNRGVGQVRAHRAGPFMHLVPVFAPVMAVAFPGEAPRLYHLGGIALIAAGLVLASTRPGPARA